jgi:hypothetical protein
MTTKYRRVYTEGGTVAHLLDDLQSPNDRSAEALCGRNPWPGYWFGSGTQDEEERAADLRICSACAGVYNHRESNYLSRSRR